MCRSVRVETTRADLEHYVRKFQSILDDAADGELRPRPSTGAKQLRDREINLVADIESTCAELGTKLRELFEWLDSNPDRRTITLRRNANRLTRRGT